jgi:hypothetical protein
MAYQLDGPNNMDDVHERLVTEKCASTEFQVGYQRGRATVATLVAEEGGIDHVGITEMQRRCYIRHYLSLCGPEDDGVIAAFREYRIYGHQDRQIYRHPDFLPTP